MGIIAGLFAAGFGRLLGRRRGALAAAAGISLYTLLVGAGAVVVRAAIMAGLSLFARQLGRSQHGLNSLAFVAAGMSAFNPKLPWDVSFQLSFPATLGLILYADPLSQAFTTWITGHVSRITAQRITRPISEYLLFTLTAQLVLRVLATGKRGAVLLEWKSFHALMPIGIDFEALEALLLADSGYAPANPPEWIERVHPQVALLSVATDDREGRPDPEVLEALEGYTLLSSDRNGWIEVTTDGEEMRVEVERR